MFRLDCGETQQRKQQEREMREYDPQFDINGFVSALRDEIQPQGWGGGGLSVHVGIASRRLCGLGGGLLRFGFD